MFWRRQLENLKNSTQTTSFIFKIHVPGNFHVPCLMFHCEEISMYLALCFIARYMEIPCTLPYVCLGGTWKFPCTLPCVSLQDTWELPCNEIKHMVIIRYMEISMYLALCLVASTKLTKITSITENLPIVLQTWQN